MILGERRRDDEQREARAALGAATAELELRQEIADLLAGHPRRRLLGPVLVGIGILLGTLANLSA
jgi:hypothetical protein